MKTEGAAAVGKQGFVFSIDATFAVFLLAIMLAVTVFLSSQAAVDAYGKLQVVRMGKDTLTVMDKRGILSSGDRVQIEAALNSTLPIGIGAHISILSYYYTNGSFNLQNVSEFGDSAPENTNVYGVARDFVEMDNGQVANYSTARMQIWQK